MAKKLSELREALGFEGLERVKFEDLVDKEITIKDVQWREGDYGEWAILKISVGDEIEEVSTATGAGPVIELLKRAIDKDVLPFTATVKASPSKKFKNKNYYTLV